MSITLPKGWINANICEMSNIEYGKGLPKKSLSSQGKYPVFGANSIIGYYDSYLYEKPQVLLSCRGANSGTINLSPKKCHVTSNSLVIQLPEKYYDSHKFIFYSLLSVNKEKIITGTAQPQVTIDNLKDFDIPLPPLNEQKRIVAKLDKIIPRIDAIKERLEKVPVIIKRFRQSVLTVAVTGKLTKKWREEHPEVERAEDKHKRNKIQKFEVPYTWDFIKLDRLIEKIQAGKNFTCPEIPVSAKTVGLVKISAVTWDKFNPKETKTVDDKKKIDSKLFIKKDDFLISRANTIELIGASVIVDKIDFRIMISDKVWRVSFNGVNKRYVNYFLKSFKGRYEIESRSSGNQQSMRNISQKAFRDIDISLPSSKEQKEIVHQVDKLFAVADKLEIHYQNAKAKVDKLTQSVLAKTFRGDLVPQDPNDEPAEKLLERIMEEKVKMEAEMMKVKKNGGKKRKGNKKAALSRKDL